MIPPSARSRSRCSRLMKSLGFQLIKIAVPQRATNKLAMVADSSSQPGLRGILWVRAMKRRGDQDRRPRVGYPREMLGVAGRLGDTRPAMLPRATPTMTFNTPGNYPVIDEIRKKVYGSGKATWPTRTVLPVVHRYHRRNAVG